MGSYIAKWIGGKLIQDKILKERLENKFGVDASIPTFGMRTHVGHLAMPYIVGQILTRYIGSLL